MSTYTEEELDLRCRHLLRYLLIAYDDSKTARSLVQQITQVARDRPENSLESCLLAWAIESKHRREIPQSQTLEDAQTVLAAVKQDLEQLNLTVATEVRQQERLQAMMSLAMEYDISAIAVNSPSIPRLLEWSRPTSPTSSYAAVGIPFSSSPIPPEARFSEIGDRNVISIG